MGTPDTQSVARTEARVADLRRECEAFLISEQGRNRRVVYSISNRVLV